MSKGKLYLIPLPIAENTVNMVLPSSINEVVKQLDFFLAENLRTARRFVSSLKTGRVIEEMSFELLNKKTTRQEAKRLMKPLLNGHHMGVMSEAGCPGIADPGALAVALAHEMEIEVIPLVGPSSIFLALMASGFNGQHFKFHGYLPIDKLKRRKAIGRLEDESKKYNQTQIFIETPYRNNQMLEDLVNTLSPSTNLCIAKDISGEDQLIKTMSVGDWKKNKIDLHKRPVVFILHVA